MTVGATLADRLREAEALYVTAPAEALRVIDAELASLPAQAPAADRMACLRRRATALTYLARYEEALATIADFERWAEADDPHARVDACRGRSFAYEQMGALEASLEWSLHAVDAARRTGRPGALAHSLLSAGVALSRSGDHESGMQRYREVLAIYESTGDAYGTMQVLNNLGIGSKNLGRLDDAVAYLQRAVTLAGTLRDEGARAVAMTNLADPLARLGRRAEARAALESAARGLGLAGYANGEAHARLQLGELLAADGDPEAAIDQFRQAQALNDRTGSRNATARVELGLANACKALGRFEAALGHHEAFHAAERAQFNEESAKQLRALQVRFDLARAQHEAEVQRLRAAELAAQSRTDALTGLANRRALDERLAAEVERAQRLAHPLALTLADIDDFKRINDRLGHATGDEVLRRVAALLRAQCRSVDLVARYGGEEFCIAFVETGPDAAAAACEAMREAVAAHDWPAVHPTLAVTLSLGLAQRRGDEDAAALLERADHHLYDAKRRGKNQVCRDA